MEEEYINYLTDSEISQQVTAAYKQAQQQYVAACIGGDGQQIQQWRDRIDYVKNQFGKYITVSYK